MFVDIQKIYMNFLDISFRQSLIPTLDVLLIFRHWWDWQWSRPPHHVTVVHAAEGLVDARIIPVMLFADSKNVDIEADGR